MAIGPSKRALGDNILHSHMIKIGKIYESSFLYDFEAFI